MAVRPSQDLIDRSLPLFHIDLPAGVRVLVDDHDSIFVLEYLKRIREIRHSWYTGQQALYFRIQGGPVLAILVAFGQSPGLIGDLSAFDYAQSRWNGGHCAEHEPFFRRRSSTLGFEVPICGVEDLPKSIRVGLAARRPCIGPAGVWAVIDVTKDSSRMDIADLVANLIISSLAPQ